MIKLLYNLQLAPKMSEMEPINVDLAEIIIKQ